MKFIFFILTLCSWLTVHADIVIEYKITLGKQNPLIDKSLLFPDRMRVSFNDKYVRVQWISQSSLDNRFDLYEIGQKFYYLCGRIRNKNRAYKTPKNNYEFAYPSDSTYVVIGYPCRKAVGKNEKEEVAEAYYTSAFGIVFFPDGDLKGIALKYKMTDNIFESITYEAISLTVTQLPSEFFSYKGYAISKIPSEKNNKIWIGRKFHFLTAYDLNGKESVLQFNRKITVINFWFLGCAPCRMEIPYLNELVNKYAQDSCIQFISIALDSPSDLRRYLKDGNVFKYQIFGNGSQAASKSWVTSYPAHFVIDKNGLVVGELYGYSQLRVTEIDSKIKEILKLKKK